MTVYSTLLFEMESRHHLQGAQPHQRVTTKKCLPNVKVLL